jgi:predicted nucleic acid-binding protein
VTPVLVDSNVLLDVAYDDQVWGEWSRRTLTRLGQSTVLVINPLIFAEVSVGFKEIEELETVLPRADFRREPLPYEAGFLAGKAYLLYRQRGGSRTSPMPDFYIGAHAAVAGYRLLTRDAKRYRSYFPTLRLIAPAD